jgi:hypothetical protein
MEYYSAIKKQNSNQVQVAHTYNPSYSGGRDKEDCSLKTAQTNSSRASISKIPKTHKKGWQNSSSGRELD